MDHYVDIRLLPDPELPEHVLMSALYGKFHKALVLEGGNRSGIAVSFPGYGSGKGSTTLGPSLRLLGSAPALQSLTQSAWLGSLRDQVSVSPLAPVPATATYRALRRVQAKSSPERLRRRLIKRHDLSEAQARERIPDAAAEKLALPFVQLHSQSTGQGFRLFLLLGPAQAAADPGTFNTYGLSATATIPWF